MHSRPTLPFILLHFNIRPRAAVSARRGAITIINLFLLPRMPPPEGHNRAIQLLYTLHRCLQFHSPPLQQPLSPLVAACFSACPFWTKIGPVKNNEVAPAHKLDRPVDSPPPFNGIFTLGGLSARNDHYELWINAYREAWCRAVGRVGECVRTYLSISMKPTAIVRGEIV